jgi:8-oxo-dGTP pyrophosphatase MutT (NUDIX family)
MREHALAIAESFDPGPDELCAKSRELILMLLRCSAEPFSRAQFAPGHITCTSAVLSPSLDQVLLVRHKRLERWLLPGGHVEPGDATLEAAARREIAEETGAAVDWALGLVGMDVHGIPPRGNEPYHQHHDLLFGFRAASPGVRVSEESDAVKWISIGTAAFDEHALAEPIRRAALRAHAGFLAISTL